MRILMIQPNYHSGGAEIAGNWPPSWVPYDWFEPDPFKRRYLLGCLWAFVKTTLNKRFIAMEHITIRC